MDIDSGHTTLAEGYSARDQRKLDKIQQIIDAASDVFFHEGFSGASMDRIVEAAGVSKRTLYNYYKSKEDIFIDVIQKQLGSIYINFEPGRLESMSLREQLQQLATHILEIANAPETLALFRIMAAETRRFPTLARHFLEESLENVISGIAEIFEREGDKAGLHIEDSHAAAELFLDLVNGSAYHRVVFGAVPPLDEHTMAHRAQTSVDYFFKVYQ